MQYGEEKKRKNESKQRLREVFKTIKHINICIMGVPALEREKGT